VGTFVGMAVNGAIAKRTGVFLAKKAAEVALESAITKVGAIVLGTAASAALIAAIKLHWDAWVWAVSGASVFGAVLFFWNRQIDRAGAARPIAQPMPTATALTGHVPSPAAIGIFREIAFEHFTDSDGWKFRCSLHVDFVSFMPCDPSPHDIRLTDKSGALLAMLSVPDGATTHCPTRVKYLGEGSWTKLIDAVRSTMSGLNVLFVDDFPIWAGAPSGTLFAELQIRRPDGTAGSNHLKSPVRFPFELAGRDHHPITIRIDSFVETGTGERTQIAASLTPL